VSGAAAASCPDSEPAEGQACSGAVDCSYGQSIRPDCRHRWGCVGGAWHAVSLACPQAPGGYCPPQEPMPSSCTPMPNAGDRAGCEYPGNIFCECACPSSGPALGCSPTEQWACYGPPATPGCPALVPNLGTACSVQGTQCAYGDPCNVGGLAVYCRAAVWHVGEVHCPT
jgi:hypothetical protein